MAIPSPLPPAPGLPDGSPAARQRALTRQYKSSPPPMGVYAIRNLATGRVVVRGSLNLPGAMNRVRFELGLRQHRDRALMDDWLRHGEANFRFEVLDTIKPREEPGFDYTSELQAMLTLWTEELSS